MIARIQPGIVPGRLVERKPRIDHGRASPDEDVVDADGRPGVDRRRDEPTPKRSDVTGARLAHRRSEPGLEQEPEGWLVGETVQVPEQDGRVGRRQGRQPGDDGACLAQPRDVAGRSVGMMKVGVGDGQGNAVGQAQPERLDDPEVRQPSRFVKCDLAR